MNTELFIEQITDEVKGNHLAEDYNFYVIAICFDTNSFYRRNRSISEFYKKLSNSKTGLFGNPKTNRDVWKLYSADGFYRYYITPNETEIIFYLKTKANIKEKDFRYRVAKILKPTYMTITETDNAGFSDGLKDLSLNQSGKEVFGRLRKGLKRN